MPLFSATLVIVELGIVNGSLIAGGVCNSTYSLNITDGRRLADVGGLRKPEVQGLLCGGKVGVEEKSKTQVKKNMKN